MDNRQREMIHTLMNQHSKPMVQAEYRRIGDWHLAEDLVQETFLTACWKANQICSHSNPTAWLYKTLNNLIMRELHRSYHKEVALDEWNEARESMDLPMHLYLPTGLSEQDKELILLRIDKKLQWAKLEEAHPLAFEDSSQLEEMAPSFPARKEKLHHVRHIHMLTRGAGVAAAVIVLSTVTANALGFHPIHAILQWAEGIVQVCINPSGTMELPNSTPSEYHSLAEALEKNGIDATGLPTWIPQDYSIYSITSKVSDGIVKCVAEFESNRGDLMMRVTSYAIENTIAVEERDESSRCYSKGNVDYYIISNNDQVKISWQIGLNAYVIGGQISENEAKKS